MRRGEVWWATLPEPWGRRPVLLIARDEAYDLLSWVMVAPLTTAIRDIPSHVVLEPAEDGVPRRSAVGLDNVQAIRKSWIESPIVRLRADRMQAIERAIHFAMNLQD